MNNQEYKYYIDGDVVTEEEFTSKLEEEISVNVDANYDDILDDCYEPYKIGNLIFYASDILKNCDPIAYRCGVSDQVSADLEDAEYELDTHGEITVYSNFSKCVVDDDDEEDNEENK